MTDQLFRDRTGIKNVIDFGADRTGSGDSLAAIQAAVDRASTPFSSANRGIIWFEPGTYNISGPVTFETATINLQFIGAPGATITGNFADALLKRSPNSPITGVHSIENLTLTNSHASGKGIMFHSCVGGTIRNCVISASGVGIENYNSQATIIESCKLNGSGKNGTGILCGNATEIRSCDVTAWDIGVCHQQAGLVIAGGRYETNRTGILLGQDENGNALQTSSFIVGGMSMESNELAVVLRAAVGGTLAFSSGAGEAGIDYGLRIINAEQVTVTCQCGSTLGFSVAGISVEDGKNLILNGCQSSTWNVASNIKSVLFNCCDVGELTFAKLPTQPNPGDTFAISDANTGAVGGTVTTTGTNHVVVMFINGSWKVIASA